MARNQVCDRQKFPIIGPLLIPLQSKHMRPLTVITGIVLGSCASISLSLLAVALVFLVVGTEHPRIAHESEGLSVSILLFLLLTAVAGMSFYSLVRNMSGWRRWQFSMWAGVLLVVWYFLPDGILIF